MNTSPSNENPPEPNVPAVDPAAGVAQPPAPEPAAPSAPAEALPLGIRRPVIKRRHKKTKDEIRRERAAARAAEAASTEDEDPATAEARKELAESLREPDEFQEVGSDFVAWVYDHRQIILTTVAVAVLAVVGWGVAESLKQAAREDAAEALFVAKKELPEAPGMFGIGEKPDPAKVSAGIAALDAVAAAHDGTIQAGEARILAAGLRMQQGEVEQALVAYDAALDEGGVVGLLARSGRVAALEQLGRLDEAITLQTTVHETSKGAGRELATLDLARLHLSKGNGDQARTLYQQFLTEFGESMQKADVEARLAALGSSGAPAEPAPAPAAPPVEAAPSDAAAATPAP